MKIGRICTQRVKHFSKWGGTDAKMGGDKINWGWGGDRSPWGGGKGFLSPPIVENPAPPPPNPGLELLTTRIEQFLIKTSIRILSVVSKYPAYHKVILPTKVTYSYYFISWNFLNVVCTSTGLCKEVCNEPLAMYLSRNSTKISSLIIWFMICCPNNYQFCVFWILNIFASRCCQKKHHFFLFFYFQNFLNVVCIDMCIYKLV